MMYSSPQGKMNTSPEHKVGSASKRTLEELVMDITCSDLNRQMQQLVSEYKKTGNQHYLDDAAYLRSEFETWWNDEVSLFAPPAEAV
jgi:hypothetical protein